MTISLNKGGKVNLGKESAAVGGNPTIKVGKFGLKWNVNPLADGQSYDLGFCCKKYEHFTESLKSFTIR